MGVNTYTSGLTICMIHQPYIHTCIHTHAHSCMHTCCTFSVIIISWSPLCLGAETGRFFAGTLLSGLAASKAPRSCVCMYVRIYVCMYVYVCTFLHMYVCMFIYMFMYVCMCVLYICTLAASKAPVSCVWMYVCMLI